MREENSCESQKIPGHKLIKGNYDTTEISDSEIMELFDNVFSSNSKNSTSYKFGFLKCILDNLYNFDEEYIISYDLLFGKFAEIYWNLVLEYGIRQMPKTEGKSGSVIERIFNEAVEKYDISAHIVFEAIEENVANKIKSRVKSLCKKNVVGALYRDTRDFFYSFSNEDEWLQMNPLFFEFLNKYRSIIEKLNYYEWAKFLEKVNDEETTYRLLNKLDKSSKRNNLSVYRDILFYEYEQKRCFYCRKEFKSLKGIHVDHFVPWSKIKDDQLWNLVLACSSCNEKKSDRIPDKVLFSEIVERNEEMIHLECASSKMRGYQPKMFGKMYESLARYSVKEAWRPERKGR